MLRVALTTGDPDGIGPEVSMKALARLGPQPGVHFFVFLPSNDRGLPAFRLPKPWKSIVCSSIDDALSASENLNSSFIFEIQSTSNTAADWVIEATKACLKKKFNGMCTAPLSKTLINSAGYRDLGHTEIFKRLSKIRAVNMAFVGKSFNVVLATDHIPLRQVPKKLTAKTLSVAIKNSLLLRQILPPQQRKLPIAWLGLNPHAGESGLLGTEEFDLTRSVKRLTSKKVLVGPVPPDVAFQKKFWKKFSVFVCGYHDQGLIPFKLVHGQDSGLQISLGLPFVRTSVDHGTAKDIFGKNQANPKSMIEAIQWCIKLIRLKSKESSRARSSHFSRI